MECFILLWKSITALMLKGLKGSDVEEGQKALIARAQANSEASKGAYVAGSQPSSDEQLFVAGYTY